MALDYYLKYPKCGNEFDLDYDQLNIFSDPNAGITWKDGTHRFSFKYPVNAARVPITTFLMMENNTLRDKHGNIAFHLWVICIIVHSITALVLVYLWTKKMRNFIRKARQNRTYKENEQSNPLS